MGILSVRRGWGCPMLDTDGSSQFQWPAAGTAEPSAMLVPQERLCEKRQSTAWQ